MKKMIFMLVLGMALGAVAKSVEASRRKPAQSGMTIQNGDMSMTSYPNQLVIDTGAEKASFLFERIAKKQLKKEVATSAKIWCDSDKACDVSWDQ